MTRYLKRGRDEEAVAAEDAKVRSAVESMLADIAKRGDAAVRELSAKFDGWDRADYRLTDAEIRDCVSQLSQRNLDDIRFAQEQVRNFAQHQKEALRDLEVELIRKAVQDARGNVMAAAKALGISRATVYRKLGRPR